MSRQGEQFLDNVPGGKDKRNQSGIEYVGSQHKKKNGERRFQSDCKVEKKLPKNSEPKKK